MGDRRMRDTNAIESGVKSFYDVEANEYSAKRWGTSSGHRLDLFQRRLVPQLLPPVRGKLCLDAGAGAGRFTQLLAELGATVVGVDISSGMLAEAKKRLGDSESITLVQASLTDLPFESGVFDFCVSITVVNLLPDIAAAIAEVARVLKQGGHFVFNFPNFHSIYLPAALYVNFRGRTRTRNRVGYRYSRWHTLGQIEKLLSSKGLVLEGAKGQPFFAPYVRNSPALAGGVLRPLCPSVYVDAVKPWS